MQEPKWKFALFDPVEKYTGDYTARGLIVGRFTMTSGAERYVVEHKADGGGSFCHIYSPANLRRIANITSADQDKD